MKNNFNDISKRLFSKNNEGGSIELTLKGEIEDAESKIKEMVLKQNLLA